MKPEHEERFRRIADDYLDRPGDDARYAYATYSAVATRAADDCSARMMHEPSRARLTSEAALLLTSASDCWFRQKAIVPA